VAMISGRLSHDIELLRVRDRGPIEVKPIELFFDLVYVLAITQLTHHLLEHLNLKGALQTLLLLLAVWWAWIDTTWFANWFDPERRVVRAVLMVSMLAGLIVSAVPPDAFGDRGMTFALVFAVSQLIKPIFAALTLGNHRELQLNYVRIIFWRAGSGVLWLAGGMSEGNLREFLWAAAVAVDISAAAARFPLPRLGRSLTRDWSIAGEHLAERFRLFIILALGESILITGANFGELPSNARTLIAFIVAFIGSITLWWIYFDRAEEAARHVIGQSADPLAGSVGPPTPITTCRWWRASSSPPRLMS
jgi:low temperature requirement protein LtrA